MRSNLALGLLTAKDGNIGLSAAITSPLIISTLALGVDYGSLTLQQRKLQQAADLAAISAASGIATAEQNVAHHLHKNGFDIPVKSGQFLLTPDGKEPIEDVGVLRSIATVVKGRYTPDATLDVEARFAPTQISPDAVAVGVSQEADLFFAKALIDPPLLYAKATATSRKEAAFSIGSRLASVNGGLLNRLLTDLFGTSIALDVMDYQALASADIDILKTMEFIGVDLGLTAGTYEDVLNSEIDVPLLIDAMTRSASGSGSAKLKSALSKLSNALNRSELVIDLAKVVNLGSFSDRPLGTASNLGMTVDALTLLSASTAVSNRVNQIASQFDLQLPGLASATVRLAVGEPPVGTPSTAVGEAGATVRTAQTRLMIVLETEKVAVLGGVQLRIPLYLEVAHAEAKLVDVTCPSGGLPAVRLLAVPGLAELTLGNVDLKAFANFGGAPRVTEARLLDTALLNISALGYANVSNLTASSVSFGPLDIQDRRTKSVSTRHTLTSLQTSLLKNVDVKIQTAGLSLGTPKTLQAAVADTLSKLTEPLDTILYNTLLALGIKVGEADIQVSFASCKRPVLVQ
jgi:uncharacterized membrane protein